MSFILNGKRKKNSSDIIFLYILSFSFQLDVMTRAAPPTKLLILLLTLTAARGCQNILEACADSPEEGRAWGYRQVDGPESWRAHFPTCGGAQQSPVALVTSTALTNATFEPFKFVNYDLVPGNTFVMNTGHGVEVRQACGASVAGGNLTGTYTFAQFHFHWGANDTSGSEHTVDGAAFPAELHLVHYREEHRSLGKAIHQVRGVAVLSVLLRLAPDDNPLLQPIVSSLADITHPGNITTAPSPLPLNDVLPDNVDDFYRYEGSLTTPGCNEVVVWTVFREPVSVSARQLQAFRRLVAADGTPLQDNFRPTQPLHGRHVYRSWA